MGQYQTFVVRLWTDETDELVRGHIQHIASQHATYFQCEPKMLEFIHEHLGPGPNASPSPSPARGGEPGRCIPPSRAGLSSQRGEKAGRGGG